MLKKIFCIIILTALLAGCGAEVQTPDTGNGNAPVGDMPVARELEPVFGGVVRLEMTAPDSGSSGIGTAGAPGWCPIYAANEESANIFNLIFDSLIDCEPSGAKPNLAQSWSVSANGLVWSITLKPDITWHDETRFTASDVEYTVNQIKADGRKNIYRACVENISRVRVISPESIDITLVKPQSNFINLLYFPIIQKQNRLDAKTYVPVGTGRFEYTPPEDAQNISLVKNPYWHGGRIYIDGVDIAVTLGNQSVAQFMFSSKETDMLLSDDINQGKTANSDGVKFTDFDTQRFSFLGFNHTNENLKELPVRKAAAHAINRKKIVENILFGRGVASFTPINPASKLSNPNNQPPVFDTDAAKRILTEDGWELNSGIFEKTVGRKTQRLQFEILINDENPVREQVAAFIEKNLMEAGIAVNIKKVPFDEYTSLISRNRFDMFLGEYDITPDLNFSFMLAGNVNPFGLRDTQLDKLLGDTQTQTDDLLVTGAYHALEKYLCDTVPVVGLYYRRSALLQNMRIAGTPKPLFYNAYRGIEDIFIIEE